MFTSMRIDASVKGGAKCSFSDGFKDGEVLTVKQCIELDNSNTLLDASNRSEEPNEQSLSSPVKQTGDEQSRVFTLIQTARELAAVPMLEQAGRKRSRPLDLKGTVREGLNEDWSQSLLKAILIPVNDKDTAVRLDHVKLIVNEVAIRFLKLPAEQQPEQLDKRGGFVKRLLTNFLRQAWPAEAQEKGKKRKNDTYRFQIKQGTVNKDVRTFLFSHCKLVDGLVIDDRFAFSHLHPDLASIPRSCDLRAALSKVITTMTPEEYKNFAVDLANVGAGARSMASRNTSTVDEESQEGGGSP